MATKTINIMDDVYDLLQSQKKPGESFSDQLRRLAREKGNIMDLAGSCSDLSERDADKIKKRVTERRKYKRAR